MQWFYRLSTMCCLVLLTIGSAQGQEATDQPKYRLRVPTANEYAEATGEIAEFLYQAWSNPFSDNFEAAIGLLEAEFLDRYGVTASATELSQFYEFMTYGFNGYAFFQPYVYPRGWNLNIVQRWLEENPTDLNTTNQLTFDRYQIDIQPYNFNHDDEIEWLLLVSRTGSNRYSDYWVARRDPAKPGGYDLIMLPIPYSSANYSSSQLEWAGARLESIRDVNDDVNDELIFTAFGIAPSSWNAASDELFFVVGWQNDRFEILTQVQNGVYELKSRSLVMRTQNPEWSFENLDTDSALELIQVENYEDNWLCSHSVVTVYDWNGSYYLPQPAQETFPETVNCALRSAEQAVEQDNYQRAIAAYKLALQRYDKLTPPVDKLTTQFAAYAQERLVIAYLFADQSANALRLIDQLRQQAPAKNTIAFALISTVDAGHQDRYSLCKAAHNVMITVRGVYRSYRTLPAIGFTRDDYYGDHLPSNGSPTESGCDLNQLTNEWIRKTAFSTASSPVDQIIEMGIELPTYWRQLHTDLNGDGYEDWIIESFLFVSRGTQYRVSTNPLFWWDRDRPPLALPLPDQAGNALLLLQGQNGFTVYAYPDNSAVDGGHLQGSFWQLQGNDLKQTMRFYLDDANISDLIDSEKRLNVLNINEEKSDSDLTWLDPVQYTWDPVQQIFETDRLLVPETTPASSITPVPDYRFNDLERAIFQDQDYEMALTISDAMLIHARSDVSPFIHYYRALALEKMNRPDEALAEYIAIYETAPDSAWGMLAALHLEKIEE